MTGLAAFFALSETEKALPHEAYKQAVFSNMLIILNMCNMFQKYYNSSCLKHPFWAKPKCVSDEIFAQPALLYFLLFTLLHFYLLTLSSSSQGRQCVTDVSRAPLRLCSVLPCRLATNHPLPECQSATMIPQSHHFLTS